jgi:hypothetical protein
MQSSRNQKQSNRVVRGLSIGTYFIVTKTKHNLHFFFTFFHPFFVSHGKKDGPEAKELERLKKERLPANY